MVLWSLAKSSLSLQAFVRSEHFAVHVLAADQRALSETFAKRGTDKFKGLALERGAGGVPLLGGCSARFQCRTAFRYEGGDHEIFVGEVIGFDHFGREPLIFHSGKYGLVVRHSQRMEARAENTDGTFSRDFLGYLLGVAYSQLFKPIRDEFHRHGFGEREYYLMSILSIDGDRSIGNVKALLDVAGHAIDGELIAHLEQRGLVLHVEDRLELTEAGRRAMIEFFAIAKSAESDAQSELDLAESQLLKQLLRRVIRSTSKHTSPTRKLPG